MINHLHPTKADLSDMHSFNFEFYGLGDRIDSDKRIIGLKVNKKFNNNEEFSYCYTKNLYPEVLIFSYGMAIENNIFAMVIINTYNFIKLNFDDKLVKLC